MATRDTAEQKLNRILYLLPAAARPQGAQLQELADALGVEKTKIGRDLTEAGDRAFYHRAGSAAEANLWIDGERVTLATPGTFRRPARLSAREAAALGMGLRSLALESSPARRARLLALAESLEQVLVLPGTARDGARVAAVHGDRPAGDAYERLRDAARLRRRCGVEYLKPGAAAPEARVIDPYALLFAERWWYVVAHCHRRDAVRVFRIDRMLTVAPGEERFELPADFDARAHAPAGRAFVADDALEAVVRYSARIARWIRERHPEAEVGEGGAVVVRHSVADPRWLVRHVLQYGAEAEVLSPAPLRAVVRQSVRGRVGEGDAP